MFQKICVCMLNAAVRDEPEGCGQHRESRVVKILDFIWKLRMR